MAKRVITQLIDDITGDPIAEGMGETIRFTINDVAYSIDLSAENVSAFQEAVAPYVAHAERVGGTRRSVMSASRSTPRTDPAQLAAIRDWARNAGYQVSDRGRIAASIREAYEDAHS